MKTPNQEPGSSVYDRNREIFNENLASEEHESVKRKAEKICRHLARIEPRARVADIGCHSGFSTERYGKVPGVVSIEGFDIADQALKALTAKGIKTFRWSGGLEACPAPDHSYDVVIASEVIEHIVDTEYFLAEIRRILKPGGHVIFTTPNLYYWLSRVRFFFGKTPWNYPGVSSTFKADRTINTEHIRVNGVGEWSAFFQARGFDVLHTEGLPLAVPTNPKAALIFLIDNLMPANARCLGLFVLKKMA